MEDDSESEAAGQLELVYGLTERNVGARIRNLMQISVGILSWSKVIFYHKIHWILEVADLSKLEIAYTDTDSCVLAAVSPDFEDCVLPEMRQKYESEKGLIFADPDSELAPNGLLKEEFRVSSDATRVVPSIPLVQMSPVLLFQADQTLIRALKMYYMLDSATDKKMVRVKGASAQTHAALNQEDFGQIVEKPLFANRYKLAPTRGHDMAISLESRKIITAFNAKRRCEVRTPSGLPDTVFDGAHACTLSLLLAGSGAFAPPLMAGEDGDSVLDAFFLRSLRKGAAPDWKALQKYARSKSLAIPDHRLREWRRRFKSTAPFERVKSNPPGHMTNQHPRYGQVMIDLAFYKEKWGRFNQGSKGESIVFPFVCFFLPHACQPPLCVAGFLVAVEMTSKQVAAVPIRSKRLSELQEAITEILETSVISKIRTIISDKETSVLSKKFRDAIRRDYGTEVKYLSKRNKSYLAEL